MKKIVTIIGARPQFVKAAAISKKINKYFDEVLIHTGQHYDDNMSDIFFKQLDIPRPDYNLNLNNMTQGELTGHMIIEIEKILIKESPECVILYGDTNSTLAGAIATSKLGIPIIHIEAGVRNNDFYSTEEINRRLTDHVSKYFFCCTEYDVKSLKKENITDNVYFTGDVMYDVFLDLLQYVNEYENEELIYPFTKGKYNLMTLHRQENVDNEVNLNNIIDGVINSNKNTIFLLHPRTRSRLIEYNLLEKIESNNRIKILSPLGYIQTLYLQLHSRKIITDSGGIQREAYFLRKPCVTVLDYSPWPSIVRAGHNKLAGTRQEAITEAVNYFDINVKNDYIFGDGTASDKIVNILNEVMYE